MNTIIKQKRKPYLRQYSETVIKEFAEAKAFPNFSEDPEENSKKEELESVIREIVSIRTREYSQG